MADSSISLRIGYVPEHFSTPLFFAQKYFSLNATLLPFPSGTGHMVTALRNNEIDIGIGLTEGWVAGLGTPEALSSPDPGYKIIGTYVDSPLCWAISTGPDRDDLNSLNDLKGARVGVSRLGSGSHIMSFVLASQQSWLAPSPSSPSSTTQSAAPFTFTPLQTFASLRQGVRDKTIDFFMWEHFTSKKYFDSGDIKRVGEIYTPWPSWMVVASTSTFPSPSKDARLSALFESLDKGIQYFEANKEEAVQHISTALDYSDADARAWLPTVAFTQGTRGVDGAVMSKVQELLLQAGVLDERADWRGMVA